MNAVVLAVGVLAAIRLWARRDWTLGTCALACITASPITGGQLISLGRYAATTFPIPLVGATDPRLRHLRPAILVVCAVGLALISAWLALGSQAAAA